MDFNTLFIGNIAFDINSFYYGNNEEKLRVKNNGGACFYSAIPASLFYKVGIVSRIGEDFNINVFDKYDIDTLGLKIFKNEKSTYFHQIYRFTDQKKREVLSQINSKLLVSEHDIPGEYLNCKHIHITTNEPIIQLKLVEYIRSQSTATISIDTIKGFSNDPITRKVFDMVDIAFIDQDFDKLLSCKAKTKIIKCGKNGCYYMSQNNNFFVNVTEANVIDKTGAGDCMNGVFINLIANGWTCEEALRKAVEVASKSILDHGVEHLEKIYTKRRYLR